MQPIVRAFSAVAAVGLLPALLAAPAPQVTNYRENLGPFAGIDNQIPTQSTTSGSLYGPHSCFQLSLGQRTRRRLKSRAVPRLQQRGEPTANSGQRGADRSWSKYVLPNSGHILKTNNLADTYDYVKLNPDI
jgi:hypothetical protein